MNYLVIWAIDIEAKSRKQAANMARIIQLDPDNQSNHFTVKLRTEGLAHDVYADLDPIKLGDL